MKKILFAILMLASMMVLVLPCFAGIENNIFVGSDEADEILEDMDLILEDVEFVDITKEDIEKEINENNILRDYIDTDIFKNNIKKADEMREYLKNAEYLYLLPVYKDVGYTLMISKGPELRKEAALDEEGIEYIKARTGKWHAPGVGVCEGNQREEEFDYKLKMEIFLRNYKIENSEIFFVGGATEKSVITGICFTEEGEEKGKGPYYVALDEINLNAKSADDVSGAVYTYDEMKEYAIKNDGGGGGLGVATSESSNTWIIFLVGVVVIVAVAAIIIIRNKKLS